MSSRSEEPEEATLHARVEALVSGPKERGPALDTLIGEGRRLDAQLAVLHAVLAETRSVEGYELARDLARARDAICARIGLMIVRGEQPVDVAFPPALPEEPPAPPVISTIPPAPAIESPASNETVPERQPAPVDPPPAISIRDPEPSIEPVPASARDVSSFVERVSKTGLGTGAALTAVHAEPPRWWGVLEDLLAQAGAPPIEEAEDAVAAEVDVLAAATAKTELPKWGALPSDAQRLWVSMLVARVCRFRDEKGLSAAQAEQIRDVVLRIQAHTKQHQTGHINGLALRHRPIAPSWGDDALRYWTDLQALLDGLEPPLQHAPARRHALRDASPPAQTRPAVPETWPFWSLLRGKNVALVGGEPREVSRARLERTLGVAQLDWISSRNPRRHDALVSAIGARGLDVVFIVRNLMSHSIQEKLIAACNEHRVGWALVDGYGATAVARGVGRYLGKRSVAE